MPVGLQPGTACMDKLVATLLRSRRTDYVSCTSAQCSLLFSLSPTQASCKHSSQMFSSCCCNQNTKREPKREGRDEREHMT